jgi:hypothetical protein
MPMGIRTRLRELDDRANRVLSRPYTDERARRAARWWWVLLLLWPAGAAYAFLSFQEAAIGFLVAPGFATFYAGYLYGERLHHLGRRSRLFDNRRP